MKFPSGGHLLIWGFYFLATSIVIGFEYWVENGLLFPWYSMLVLLIAPALTVTLLISLICCIREQKSSPCRWTCLGRLFLSPAMLIGLLLLIASNFALFWQKEPITPELIVLLTGLLAAQCVAVWRARACPETKTRTFYLQILIALSGVITAASVFHPNWSAASQLYEYRGTPRWTGPVKDPNHFGLLMALGLILDAGLGAVFLWYFREFSRGYSLFICTLLFSSMTLIGVALIKSYSRGAWLASVIGFGYLLASYTKIRRNRSRTKGVIRSAECPSSFRSSSGPVGFWRKNLMSLSLIVVALIIFSYYGFRNSEQRIIRRIFSPANVYDFSWRNRLVGYTGALQIMADNPLIGIGWGRQQICYDEYYRPFRLTEGYAILLNDYFNVGMILGLPALFCLLAYFWLALKCSDTPYPPEKSGSSWKCVTGEPDTLEPRLRIACRAGVIALLVGFWFDHGLFMVPLGLPFWFLLELGKENHHFRLQRMGRIQDCG